MLFKTFDAIDEGVEPGGMRSKNDIKILICYLFYSIGEKLTREMIIEAIQKESLANYFETTVAFDDLVMSHHLTEAGIDDGEIYYILSESGRIIATQLNSTLADKAKDKAFSCAIKLLREKKITKENNAEIVKTDNGFRVDFTISGGDMELMSFSMYAPDMQQALIMKKSFYNNPATIYKTMLALLTEDKSLVGEALEELYGII